MGTTTPNMGLYKPDLDEAGSSWYDNINANFDKLDKRIELNLLDFLPSGYVTDGSVDYTAQVLAALTYASANTLGIVFGSKIIVQTSPIVIANSGNVPLYVNLNGSTLKAKTGSTGAFVTIENPQTKIPYGFRFENGTLDANGQCSTGLYIHGSQHCCYKNIEVFSSTGIGISINGESGYGIYYNEFLNLRSGKNNFSNGSHGWSIISPLASGVYVASNTFTNCKSQANKGDGFYINWSNNVYVGCSAEKNDTYGFKFLYCHANEIIGGYSELNHQNRATNGASDGTADESFYFNDSNTAGVKIIGGRHYGIISGNTTGYGNFLLPENKIWALSHDENGILTSYGGVYIRPEGGLALGGASIIPNGINCSAGTFAFYASGSSFLAGNTTHIRLLKPARVQDSNACLFAGAGTPEGTVTASPGSVYLNTTGGAGVSLYIKESGSGNTGWVAK